MRGPDWVPADCRLLLDSEMGYLAGPLERAIIHSLNVSFSTSPRIIHPAPCDRLLPTLAGTLSTYYGARHRCEPYRVKLNVDVQATRRTGFEPASCGDHYPSARRPA